jgi:hypothetical protein
VTPYLSEGSNFTPEEADHRVSTTFCETWINARTHAILNFQIFLLDKLCTAASEISYFLYKKIP